MRLYRNCVFSGFDSKLKEIDNTGKASLLALSQFRNQKNSSKLKRKYFSGNVHKTRAIRIHIPDIRNIFNSLYLLS